MVSGKPPRHSKSKAEPVTIDLDAKDVTDIGKADQPTVPDVDSSKTSGDAVAEPGVDVPKDAAKAENPKPVWDQTQQPPIEPEPNVARSGDVKGGETKGDELKAGTPTSPSTAKVSAPVSPAIGTAEAAKAAGDAKPSETKSLGTKPEAVKAEPPKADATQSHTAKAQATTPPPGTKASSTMQADTKPAAAKGAGNSGVLAAGIVGGIVAILIAGSMQYAGYLPPLASGNGSSGELAALKADLGRLQQQIANRPQQPADTSALEQRLAAVENAASGGDVSGKIAELESAMSTLQSERAAQDERTAEVSRRLADAEAKLNEPRDDIEVARAIASAGLKAAIDRGGPFLAELDTLSRVTPDDPAVQSLRPFANTGVPSRAELVRNFPDVATAMLASLRQSDPNQGIVDRLTESALSLVKVRPVGNVEGEGPEAKIARMEDKLRNGDLKGAALEWDGLPEPAKAASADYKKSLDARVQVEDLVNGTLTRAISSTGQQR